jgi:hypothetical protein
MPDQPGSLLPRCTERKVSVTSHFPLAETRPSNKDGGISS